MRICWQFLSWGGHVEGKLYCPVNLYFQQLYRYRWCKSYP